MTDTVTPARRSAIMRAVPARDSTAELRVRRRLTAMGLRYRLHRRDLPGSPDIVFPSRRLALFVHGCFWHGHGWPRGARVPKSNTGYWLAKIARNRDRDARACTDLAASGWRATTVWECELKDPASLEAILRHILLEPRQG